MREFLSNVFGNIAGEAVWSLVGIALLWLFQEVRKRWQARSIRSGRHTSSPDHTKIATERDGEIYVQDASGVHNLTKHPALDYDPQWSPDSTKIAYISDRDGSWQVWVALVQTAKKVPLTSGPGAKRPIRWEPDGALVIDLGGSYITVRAAEIEKRLA